MFIADFQHSSPVRLWSSEHRIDPAVHARVMAHICVTAEQTRLSANQPWNTRNTISALPAIVMIVATVSTSTPYSTAREGVVWNTRLTELTAKSTTRPISITCSKILVKYYAILHF